MHLHCWKERLKIWKLTRFKGDTLKASEDLVAQSRREIFLALVWWGGGGAQICPLLTNVTSQSYIIVKSRSNLASLLIVGGGGVRFRRVDGFSPVKSWKSRGRVFDHNLLVFSAKELTGSNIKNVYPYDFVTEELLHGWTGRFLWN